MLSYCGGKEEREGQREEVADHVIRQVSTISLVLEQPSLMAVTLTHTHTHAHTLTHRVEAGLRLDYHST